VALKRVLKISQEIVTSTLSLRDQVIALNLALPFSTRGLSQDSYKYNNIVDKRYIYRL